MYFVVFTSIHLIVFMIPPPLGLTLFPYTTLFRSRSQNRVEDVRPEAAINHGAQREDNSQYDRRKVRQQIHKSEKSIPAWNRVDVDLRSEEHTSELQSQSNLVCRLLLEK